MKNKSKIVKKKASKLIKKPKKQVKKLKVIKRTIKRKVTPKVIIEPEVKDVTIERSTVSLNVPATQEQQAGVPSVVNGNNFEGVKHLDKMPFSEQIDQIFNPLHTITKTNLNDAVTESTFIVSPKVDSSK